MAREVKTLIWCDLCLELDAVQAEGEEMPAITVGNKKPRVLALCKGHQVDFFDKFVEVLESAGITVDQLTNPGRPTRSSAVRPHPRTLDASTGKGVMCPIEGCEAKPLKNVSTISSHLRQIHAMSLYEAVGKDGQLFDADGDPVEMPEIRAPRSTPPEVTRAECDQPGCDTVYEYPKHTKPVQALGVHMAKTHGIKGIGKSGKKKQVA